MGIASDLKARRALRTANYAQNQLNQAILRNSKNLLGLSDVGTVNLPAGMTYSVADGVITLTGTTTAQVDIILEIEAPVSASSVAPVRYSVVTNATNTQISLGTNGAALNNLPWGTAPAGNSRTINTDIVITSMVLRIQNGVTFDGMTIKCQIENGTIATQYQKYYVYEQNQDYINPFTNRIRHIDVTRMGYVADGTGATLIGVISADANWEYQKVTLLRGEKIRFTVSTIVGALPLAKYDADWAYVSAVNAVTNVGYVTNTYEYIAVDDVEYLIISNASVNLALLFYRYDRSLSEVRNANLYGKVLTVIGDSYVANNTDAVAKTWHYKLADKYGMTYNNLGLNGGGVVGVRNGIVPVVERYTDIPVNSDYVVVIGGENDYNISLPMEEFKAGLDTLLLGLIGVYVENGAKLAFFLPWNRGTNTVLNSYSEATLERCQYYSVPCFNSLTDADLYPTLSAGYRTIFYQTSTDTSHLNERGHNRFFSKAEAFMLKQ